MSNVVIGATSDLVQAQEQNSGDKAAFAQQMFDQFVGGTLTNCFFKYGPTGSDPLNNRAFPDAGAIYWAASFVRPPGSKVEIEGLYPYSRFMSFISYDKAGLFVDGTADYMIDPDPGSTNTFRPGALRYATPEDQRKFTVEVRLAEKPSSLPLVQNAGQPPRNYLYSLPSRNLWIDEKSGNPVETILYRVYIPDRGLDYAGGLPVPSVRLTLADGTVMRGREACDTLRSNPKAPEETFTPNLSALVMPIDQWKRLSAPEGVPSTFPARYPADWRAAYDPAYNKDQFSLDPVDYSDPGIPTPPKVGGSYYPNVFNTYLRTFINRDFGKVVVIRLKPWTTVKSYNHTPVFDPSGADLRFWSISLSESQATTRVMDGVFDEEFPVNSDGYVTFVASSEQDRPRFATAECGVGWANWSLRGDGVGNPQFGWLSIRNMLPEPGTKDNFFAFKRPGDERQVLGEHYPELKYYKDPATFDALGCGGAATMHAMKDIPARESPRAVGWPYVLGWERSGP
ncbi:MAG: hypothetical protein NTU78_17080 [Alphaproteobacteria bacterium]|nr:hypothetical protein [Alphaproteobacteria bacterium]